MKLQKGIFTCTDVERIVGYYDPNDRWNGWYSPYFEFSEIPKIVDAFGPSEPGREGICEDQTIFDYRDDCFYSASMICRDGKWVIDYDNCDGWFSEGEPEVMDTVDGRKKLYPLGGGWMTWGLIKPISSGSKRSMFKPKLRKGRA